MGVYGPHHDAEKISFLNEIREVRSLCVSPWMMAGDFNMIYSSEDKNNNNLNRAMMGRFWRLVNELELQEIPLLGRCYTWFNERTARTLAKLDRVLCTADWEGLYPECLLQSQTTEISDHCPLLLGLREVIQGKKRFHFKSFGPNLMGSMKLCRIRGQHQCKPPVRSSAYQTSSKGLHGRSNLGATSRSVISTLSLESLGIYTCQRSHKIIVPVIRSKIG